MLHCKMSITNGEIETQLMSLLFIFLSADFGGVRPGQPGRGVPGRSVSLDMNVSPQQPSLQYPIRATSPYTLVQQQQQQGMVGNHNMMANQPAMVNTGGFNSHTNVYYIVQCSTTKVLKKKKNFLYLLHKNGEKYSCQHFILEIKSKVLKVNCW